MQVICAWCGKLLGVKECEWTEGAVSHGICPTCLEGLNEVEIEEGDVGTEEEWEAIRDVAASDSEGYGECAMGPDSSEWERTGLGEGEGIT